ncbi:MAG: hypothetical protein ACE5JL_06840 [Dehalococcoidia bacterium]
MTLHVCVLGIDGSGKSTITAALPAVLSGEFNLRVVSAGEGFRVADPTQDLMAPGFYPFDLPITVRLSRLFKWIAKRTVNSPRLYPYFKLAQMILQDAAAQTLAGRYGADVVVSDGNTLLSAIGRAGNYLRPASHGINPPVSSPDSADLKAVFKYIIDDTPMAEASKAGLPSLGKAKFIQRLIRRSGLRIGWLPDFVIFLDASPQTALNRIAFRGRRLDRHENSKDLAQARRMYLKALDAFGQYNSPDLVHRISADALTPGQVLESVVEALRSYLKPLENKTSAKEPLGTTSEKLSGGSKWIKLFNPSYLLGYLPVHSFRGAWREPTFPFSGLGRLLLKEGYSAGVMRAIYDQDHTPYGWLDRVFLGYPLHRAVHNRLLILTRVLESELERKLSDNDEITILTAPSGFAYDLFRPLERAIARNSNIAKQVRIVTSDLDPHNYLEKELQERAISLGVRLQFIRGDMTADETQWKFKNAGPYDMVIFVGLSGWLPKPYVLRHLQWVRRHLRDDGVLVSDCFTPEAYAHSGRYLGYKANYYHPDIYSALADYCGFDGLSARIESSSNRINHTMSLPLRREVPPIADYQKERVQISAEVS